MLAGYARVSTLDQNPGLQLDALGAAGCERIFEDRSSVYSSRLTSMCRRAWMKMQVIVSGKVDEPE